jgi:hypothetical protein
MQHLNEEELVLHYYHDADSRPDATDHLRQCAECRAHYDTLASVLSLVKALPVPDRGEDYGAEVWKSLRWKLGKENRTSWTSYAAIAAALGLAFFAGLLWRSRPESQPVTAVTASAPASSSTVTATAASEEETADTPTYDRFLLLVVSDHLDTSERVLLEVVNAKSNRRLDNTEQARRAEDLVAANRLYRQAALTRGDERIAAVLSELEPVLIELSHAGATIEKDKLANLQRRIESRGLLFKVRVISAQGEGGNETPPPYTETL